MLRKLLDRNMDYGLMLAAIMLMSIGVVMIHSTSSGHHLEGSDFWIKQLLWVCLSIGIMLAVILVPHKFFYTFAYLLFGIGIALLILTEFYGTKGFGSMRWLKLGSFRFQPSEFMKFATVITLARYMSFKKDRPTSYLKCLVPFTIVFIPAVLILRQPDLSTSLVFGAIFLPMIYWAGLDTLHLFYIVAPFISAILTAPFIPFFSWVYWAVFMFILLGVLYYSRFSFIIIGLMLFINIFAGIATPVVFNKLKPYQQKRITTVINPEADPQGAGWQIINSEIALGSGGLLGKGIGEGRYTELGFLPNSHTDFIFSVIGEELGLVGAMFVLLLIYYIVYRGIMIAAELKNPFMSIASIGIATIFAFHMFVNVGMVIGIMPVTGLPLPFLSYGGSACISNAVMIGLLLNFSVNRLDY